MGILDGIIYAFHVRLVCQVLEAGRPRFYDYLAREYVLVGVRGNDRHFLIQHRVRVDTGIQLEARSVIVVGG